jgi:hypothetical protein
MTRPFKSHKQRPRTLLLISSMALLHPCSSFSPSSHPNRRHHHCHPNNISPITTASASSSSSSDTAGTHAHAHASTANSHSNSLLHSFYRSLNTLYDNTQLRIKCPFLRRRVADCLDNTAMLLQFLLIRHKSLGLTDPDHQLMTAFGMPGCKPTGRHIKTTAKDRHLSLMEVQSRIFHDWNDDNHKGKGYYITGKLDTTVYRDDCLFTGPDPDMPVRGLRKYLSAAAQLFDSKSSMAHLHSIASNEEENSITVHWSLGGVINLPWHPAVEPWTGWTTYHVDEEGLIYWHEEGWDVEVWRIFMGVVFPTVRWVDVIF